MRSQKAAEVQKRRCPKCEPQALHQAWAGEPAKEGKGGRPCNRRRKPSPKQDDVVSWRLREESVLEAA